MPVLARETLEADPDGLERLRAVLHGPGGRARIEADRHVTAPRSGTDRRDGPDLAKSFGLLVERRRDPAR